MTVVLRRRSGLYTFNGHTDVKELALYIQDSITKGNWALNLGLRGDFYNGLTTHKEAEPRLGVAYNIKRTNTVLRISYARTMETPFNENLVLSSMGAATPYSIRFYSAPGQTSPRLVQAGGMNSMPAFSRLSESISYFPASTSGSTRTTPTTSVCWARRRSLSRLNGIARRFLDTRAE